MSGSDTGPCQVRRATSQDADASVALLIASITQLCASDHHDDPQTLARWLGNKTPARFAEWLADPESSLVVAELGSTLCGVASLHSSGAIRLCYVLPGMQRRGIGRALIHFLEREASLRGAARLELTSTGSARRFYEELGFAPSGDARTVFGTLKEYPYAKPLRQGGV